IPSTGYTFRFWSLYQTENKEGPWDPRWVQISVNGEAFQNLYRFQDDEQGVWLQSPAISLDAYVGQSIQLRFHFSSIDDELNDFLGWAIDDLTITQETPPACLDPYEPNDSPAAAADISYGADLDAEICPSGDLDYYSFEGDEGDRVYVDINAEVDGSALDSYLYLLAADGTSVLASNDDEVLFTRHDSQIGFRLPETGSYFIKVRAWDHPGAGSPGHSYRLRVGTDNGDPDLSLNGPTSYSYLPSGPIELAATASDGQTEVSHVEFLWHEYDWTDAGWTVLHDDWDSSDGWNAAFDSGSHPEGSGLAFAAISYDLAGNVASGGAWEIGIDRTPPATAILPLPPTHASTAVWISWQATDNISGIEHFELQSRIDGGAWQDYGENISGYAQGTWFVGEPGQLVDFRLRAVDRAGNLEEYPSGAEATTYLLPCTSPDPWEPDGTASEATTVSPGETPQLHNFCLPSDQDWIRLDALAGAHYRIFVLPASPDSAAKIEIYHADGTTLLNSQSAAEFGAFLEAGFTAPGTGAYFLRITHINPQVAGDLVSYLVWIEEGYETFLPKVSQTAGP
ncbi:MAG TPA: PPC domain-containing protein, partial [Anaerolineales bacterium]|nr:PPC domain-containing protein [Anaerolineales bacterium]